MAPYTMRVVIQNDTKYQLSDKGWAHYASLDGNSDGRVSDIGPNVREEGAYFEKGGGTDGLFSGALYSFGGSRNLFVYVSMPATSGAHVSVTAAFTPTSQGAQELVQQAVNSGLGGAHQSDTLSISGEEVLLQVDVLEARDTYPDSRCEIRVQAYKKN